MFEIKTTPILILSTPRSGSSALGKYIKTLCEKDIPYFLEPDYSGQQGVNNFRNEFYRSKDFILKCHLINLHKYGGSISTYLLQHAYKIRIRRNDVVKQIASYYIANVRNKKWHFTNKEELNLTDYIPINFNLLKSYIMFIKYSNKILDTTNINFDLDLYYEDLPDLDSTGFYITPPPKNYDELLDIIQKSYNGGLKG